jgi:hypothetical protein
MSASSLLTNPLTLNVPAEVVFSDICCVGMSTSCSIPVFNGNQCGIEVRLRFEPVLVDGRAMDHSTYLPFDVQFQNLQLGRGVRQDLQVCLKMSQSRLTRT